MCSDTWGVLGVRLKQRYLVWLIPLWLWEVQGLGVEELQGLREEELQGGWGGGAGRERRQLQGWCRRWVELCLTARGGAGPRTLWEALQSPVTALWMEMSELGSEVNKASSSVWREEVKSSDGSISVCVIVPLRALWPFPPLDQKHTPRDIPALMGFSLQVKGQQWLELVTECLINKYSVLKVNTGHLILLICIKLRFYPLHKYRIFGCSKYTCTFLEQ